MKLSFFKVSRAALCLLCGVSLSALELGFFGEAPFLSVYFLIVLAVTVPAVFLCAGAKGNVFYIFMYTLVVAFLFEVIGQDTDIRILLACLFAQALLFVQTGFSVNAARFAAKRPAFGVSLVTVLICISIVSALTFLVYRHVLEPILPESEKYALLYYEPPPAPEPEVQAPPPVRPTHANIDDGSEEIIPPEPPREPPSPLIIPAFVLALLLIFGAYAAFRYCRHRRWLSKTLSATPEEQVFIFYRYFLRVLGVCGHPRGKSETPLEFLKRSGTDSLPLPAAEFCAVTDTFIASRYGGKKVSGRELDRCVSLFSALPPLIKAKLGRRFYYFRYLRHMY